MVDGFIPPHLEHKLVSSCWKLREIYFIAAADLYEETQNRKVRLANVLPASGLSRF